MIWNQGSTINLKMLSYQSICNEPINFMVLIKQFPYKFKVPQIAQLKGKEYQRENLRKFKYSCYLISNYDVLILSTFPMNLAGQVLDRYNNFPQHKIYFFEKLASLFLYHFSINIRKTSYIMELTRTSQHDNDSINNYVAIWIVIVTYFSYSLP